MICAKHFLPETFALTNSSSAVKNRDRFSQFNIKFSNGEGTPYIGYTGICGLYRWVLLPKSVNMDQFSMAIFSISHPIFQN